MGRPLKLSIADIEYAKENPDRKSLRELARELGVSVPTLLNALKGRGGYSGYQANN